MAKSVLANALKERSAKLSAPSSNVDQTVDEAFEGLFGTISTTRRNRIARLKSRLNSYILSLHLISVSNRTVKKI